ncbi:MAG: hypothetical protein K6B72_13290 [Lachnospiraceae bacterium]|nr:hypothetical protein [Lachnospiraceae bacterium]
MKQSRFTAFVMVITMVICLSACGEKEEKEEKHSEKKSKKVTETVDEDFSDEDIEEMDEFSEELFGEEKKEEKSEETEQKQFEPSQEILDARFIDGMVQIDDVLLRLDGSMTLGEVRDKLLQGEDAEEYSFSIFNNKSKEFVFTGLIEKNQTDYVDLIKHGQKYATISFRNYNAEKDISKVEDCMVCRIDANKLNNVAKNNVFYAKGINGNGNGFDVDSVPDLFPGIEQDDFGAFGNFYAYSFDKDRYSVEIVMPYEIPGEKKEHLVYSMCFVIDMTTGKGNHFEIVGVSPWSGDFLQKYLQAEGVE